jgi:SAM-dependent methyltransferase
MLYDRFTKHLPKKAHILEAGCGSGRDAKALIERGYQVTAFDGSATLVKLAEDYLGQTVLHLTFDEMAFDNDFEGIWANASLLHVRRDEMVTVFRKFIKALKPNGVWYASFKHGQGEIIADDGRVFTFYDEATMRELVAAFDDLEIIEMTVTEDARADHQGEYWLNVIMRKI